MHARHLPRNWKMAGVCPGLKYRPSSKARSSLVKLVITLHAPVGGDQDRAVVIRPRPQGSFKGMPNATALPVLSAAQGHDSLNLHQCLRQSDEAVPHL